MNTRRHVVGLIAALSAGVALARPLPSQPTDAALTRLDHWLVLRYRGTGLLPDTASAAPSLATTRTPPRIESIIAGRTVDTLWAVHFAPADGGPAFAIGASVRLTGPTGAVSPLTARVAARRPFRAPRMPNADPTRDSSWREGWAYLVLLPHDASRTAARYGGWLLLGAPRTTRPARASPRPSR